MPVTPDGTPGTRADRRDAAHLLDGAMAVAVTGFVAVGLSTLAAAVAGVARPAPVAVASLAVWAGLVALWRPFAREPRSDRVVQGPDGGEVRRPRPVLVLVGLAVVLGSGAHNLRHQGDYVVTDRDPGIYVNGGLWIARHGDLVVDGGGEGLDDVDGVVSWAAGQSETDGAPDRLQVQGAHLFHSVLAVGEWVGGSAGFAAVPAVVGALALATFLWLALRLLPDWAAVVATAALAVDFAWIYTVRSTLSEPTLLLLSFSGAVMLVDAARSWPRRPARMAVAGFVAATALTSRVDAGVVIMAFPVLVALLVRRRGGGSPRRALAVWGLGFAPPLVVAAVDLSVRSPRYLSDLGSEVTLVVAGLCASAVAAVGVAVWPTGTAAGAGGGSGGAFHLAGRIASWSAHRARLLGAVAVAGVLALTAFAWFVRPHLGPDRVDRGGAGWQVMESIQVHEGLEPDGTRTYAERSLDRVRWYTGPVAVAAGAAGLALLAWRLFAGRLRDVDWTVAGLVVPCLVLYVYAPSIYSDHPWMIRRYVPTAIPGLVLFSALAAASLGSVRRLPVAGRVAGAAAVCAGLIAFPLATTWPLRAATWQAGGRDGIERLCTELRPDDLVVLAADGSTALTLLPAVRSVCDTDAVGLAPGVDATEGAGAVEEVARIVGAEGREVEVVAPTREVLTTLAPGAVDLRTVTVLQTSMVGTTIGRVPSAIGDHALTVWIGTLEPPVA